MPRDGAIIFGDLIGKLEVLHVACDKCGRKGRYAVARLIEQRGRDASYRLLISQSSSGSSSIERVCELTHRYYLLRTLTPVSTVITDWS